MNKKSSFTIGWEFIHKPTTLTTSAAVAATSIAYMNKKKAYLHGKLAEKQTVENVWDKKPSYFNQGLESCKQLEEKKHNKLLQI